MRRIAALLAPLLLAASAPPVAHPALWVVRDADTTIYLLGTVHALPAGLAWQDARIARAVARSDRLVIETLAGDPQTMAALLFEMGTDRAAGLPPLADRVPPEKRALLAALIGKAGVPAALIDAMETWTAAFLLARPMLDALGLSSDSGVEEVLKRSFVARSRPVEGLETVRQQLDYVDGLPEADQRRLLDGFVERPEQVRAEFGRMLAAWGKGDEAAIARSFDQELTASPALRDRLLTRRNAAWAAGIEARLARPGTILVAVGAGHLAGAQSVQAMLARRGVATHRVR